MTTAQMDSLLNQREAQTSLTAAPVKRRIGVIDIGSNSVRLVIYEIFGAAATPVYNEKILAGLGRSLKLNGKLYAPGTAQTYKALTRFKLLCDAHELDDVCVVATAAMREASDGPAFTARVKQDIGFTIEVLTGEQEAEMAGYGVISGEARARGVVADLGGASLELIMVNDRQTGHGESFPVGPFVMMDAKDYDPQRIRRKIARALSGIEKRFHIHKDTLYLVGGAWRNLALIQNQRKGYPLEILHNFSMQPEDARQLAQWAGDTAAQDLMTWPGISSRRAETLPYSGLMLEALVAKLKPAQIVISPSGVREGRLYVSQSDAMRARTPLLDACAHLADGNQQGAGFGAPLYDWLSGAAKAFPISFERSNEQRLRRAACILVGMGKGLHPDHRADLVFEDVLYAPLAGLTHKERAYLAVMLYSSYTAQTRTPNDAAIDYHLLEREKNSARIYGMAMRMSTVISGRSVDMLKKFTLSVADDTLWLKVDENSQSLLNRRGMLRLKSLAALLSLNVDSNWQESH